MSFQEIEGEQDHRVLTWSFEQRAGSTHAKLILITLESMAKNIIEVNSMDDLCRRSMSTQRTFKKYIAQLKDKGLINLAKLKDGFLSISFGPYKVILRDYRSVTVDDAWSIIRAKTFALKGYHCAYCGREAGQVDHVIPRCKGGKDDIDNLVPCCSHCNRSKGGRTPKEWLQ